jgi:type I restriction enzyme S subunit
VSEYPIGLPPLSEQRRIVAKIEELFSNLDAGMDDLQAAGQQLERYRLSVLQAAVEGRLTADWRRTHDPEPADQLLERILEEHRKQWEVEYRWRRYDARGKEPPSGWKERYSPPEHLEDESNLFSIPENWEWVRSEQICGFITKGTTPKSDKMYPGEGEVPFVKVYNLTETGELDFTVDPTFVDRETHEGKLARSRLLPGDVVMNIVGPPLGQVSVVPDDFPEWNMNQAVVRYRPLDGVDRRYLTYALRAKSILNWAIRKRKATAGQFNLTLAICRDLPIPLPPLAEQKQIVDEVERLLSVANDAAATAEREHTRAERLRQSILKQAFSGRLVPHDEDADPPAIEASSSNGTWHDSSSSTGSSTEEDSSGEGDVIAEELHNDGDPGKQIEMDL